MDVLKELDEARASLRACLHDGDLVDAARRLCTIARACDRNLVDDVVVLLENGRLTRDEWLLLPALVSIARIHEAGDAERARALLARLAELSMPLRVWSPDQAVVIALFAVKDIDRGLFVRLLHAPGDDSTRGRLCAVLARKGEADLAFELAHACSTTDGKVGAMREIARALQKAGETERAVEALRAAAAALPTSGPDASRLHVAIAQAELGDVEQALSTAQPAVLNEPWATLALARQVVRHGYAEEARLLVGNLLGVAFKDETRLAILLPLLAHVDSERATALAARLTPSTDEAALAVGAHVARYHWRHGQREKVSGFLLQALRAARAQRADAHISEVALVLLERDQIRLAAACLAGIHDRAMRNGLCLRIHQSLLDRGRNRTALAFAMRHLDRPIVPLVRAGHLDRALSLAWNQAQSFERDMAVEDIVRTLTELGRVEEARRIIDMGTDARCRYQLFEQLIAALEARGGDTRPFLLEMAHAQWRSHLSMLGVNVLVSMVCGLLRRGRYAAGIAIFNLIGDHETQLHVLYNLPRFPVHDTSLREALEAIRTVQGEHTRMTALRQLVEPALRVALDSTNRRPSSTLNSYAPAADEGWEGAVCWACAALQECDEEAVDVALDVVRQRVDENNDENRVRAMAAVAVLHAVARDARETEARFTKAERLAAELPAPRNSAAFNDIAFYRAMVGAFEAAHAAASQVSAAHLRAHCLWTISVEETRHDVDRAIATAHAIADPILRSQSAHHVAQGLVELGRLEEASELLNRFPEAGRDRFVTCLMARKRAESGDLQAALRTLGHDVELRPHGLVAIAMGLRHGGDKERARDVLADLPQACVDASIQEHQLAWLCVELINEGELALALKLADRHLTPVADPYLWVLEALADGGHREAFIERMVTASAQPMNALRCCSVLPLLDSAQAVSVARVVAAVAP